MTILVDIGNTHLKYIVAEQITNNKIIKITTQDIDNYWLDKYWLNTKKIIVANVSQHSLIEQLKTWANKNNIVVEEIYSAQQAFGLTNGYENHQSLGVDRWLAMLGARNIYPNENILIVDAGTATTVDFVLANGCHQGGWIIPGIDLMIDAVLSKTSQVQANKNLEGNIGFAKTTSDNVNHGIWSATVGAIYCALNELKKRNITTVRVVFTGGNGKQLSTLIATPNVNHENLIFIGMKHYL